MYIYSLHYRGNLSSRPVILNAVSINIFLSVFFQMMDSRASQQQGGVLVLMFC